MKTLLTVLAFFIALPVFSQDLLIPNNPYESADETIRSRKAFNRERWFYEQRMYPSNKLPEDAYINAMKQKDDLKGEEGYFMQGVFDTWVNLGPTTGFYFNYSNISSRMVTVKYDPLNPDIIYTGAAFGGIWKSTDGGNTWSVKSDYEVSLSSGSVAIDNQNTNVIYYGTGEATYSGASYYGRGILKSTDAGNTWKNYFADMPSQTYCSRIVIRPGNSNHLLAAMGTSGLYRSVNGGEIWTQVVSGRCDDVVFSPTGDTAYIVGSGTGYRISYNGGETFVPGQPLPSGTRFHIAVCRSFPNILYYSVYSGSSITVYKSTNSGSSFSQVAAGHNFSGSQAWYDFYMHVNPFDPDYAYVGSIDIWRTTNGGSSFSNITNGYGGGNVHVDQHNLDFHPTDPDKMICVNDGGVWMSTNRGTSWTNKNTNQTLTQFYRIASDPSNAAHILGGTQDNGTQRTTGSSNWAAAFGGDGGEVCFHIKNNSYILGETQNNGVYRSTNGGASFSSSTSGLSGSAAWVSPIISHPDSNGIFYTARQRVFKSTNWGSSWTAISNGTSGTIREMAISKSSANVMYASSGSSMFVSTDRGYNYSAASSGLPARTITSISVHPDSPNVAVVSQSGFGTAKIHKTTNSGASWTAISGNLPDSPVNDAMIYHPGAPTSTYFAATDVGVFVSNNYGQNWIELANGLPNTVAIHLDYHAATQKLRVGTHGRGVFEIQLAGFIPVDAASVYPGPSGLQVYASTMIVPQGIVKNLGTADATFSVTRKIQPGNYSSTKSVTVQGNGTNQQVNFDPWTFTSGTVYTVRDSVHISGDVNNLNDITTAILTACEGGIITRLSENFDNTAYPPAGWTRSVVSGSPSNYWSRNSVSSFGKGSGSSKYAFYNSPAGDVQSLTTPVFTRSKAGEKLEFDLAYAPKPNSSAVDSIRVEASTNGGTTFMHIGSYWGSYNGGTMNTAGGTTGDFVPQSVQWIRRSLAIPEFADRIRFTAVSQNGNNFYVDSVVVQAFKLRTELSISVIPQAFMNTSTGRLNMKDTVRLFVRESFAPFAVVDSASAVLDSANFTARFSLANSTSGTYYYVIKHRNMLETWSRSGGEAFTAGGQSAFDFTQSASMAYGSNQTVTVNGFIAAYSGDANNDGLIDITDIALIDNDVSIFATGYLKTDIDGNGIVDLADLLHADNNAASFISVMRP